MGNVKTITNYTVSTNKYGAIDVHFNEKPGKSVLEKIKDKGFRYFKPTQVWSTFKFESEADCLAWLVSNGITNELNEVATKSKTTKIEKEAKKTTLKSKTDNSTTLKQKAVKSPKIKVLEQVGTQTISQVDKIEQTYKHFEAELKEKYSESDRQTKSLFISTSGTGYAVIDLDKYLNLPKAVKKEFDKNYISYAWGC